MAETVEATNVECIPDRRLGRVRSEMLRAKEEMPRVTKRARENGRKFRFPSAGRDPHRDSGWSQLRGYRIALPFLQPYAHVRAEQTHTHCTHTHTKAHARVRAREQEQRPVFGIVRARGGVHFYRTAQQDDNTTALPHVRRLRSGSEPQRYPCAYHLPGDLEPSLAQSPPRTITHANFDPTLGMVIHLCLPALPLRAGGAFTPPWPRRSSTPGRSSEPP